MFKTKITPRMGDTDAMRHITNTALPVWFEVARDDIIKIFNPSCELTYKKWNLIIAHMDFNFIKQLYFGYDVEIRTYIIKIGKSSFTVLHEAWQNGKLRCNGKVTMIHYDFIRQEPNMIPEDIREVLKEHLVDINELEKNNKIEEKNNKKIVEKEFIESDE